MKIRESDKEKILKLRRKSLSYRKIGKRYGCSASTILRHVQEWTKKDFRKQIARK